MSSHRVISFRHELPCLQYKISMENMAVALLDLKINFSILIHDQKIIIPRIFTTNLSMRYI